MEEGRDDREERRNEQQEDMRDEKETERRDEEETDCGDSKPTTVNQETKEDESNPTANLLPQLDDNESSPTTTMQQPNTMMQQPNTMMARAHPNNDT